MDMKWPVKIDAARGIKIGNYDVNLPSVYLSEARPEVTVYLPVVQLPVHIFM